MINWQFFFDQPEKNYLRTWDNIRKENHFHENDCTTGCLLDYPDFKENYFTGNLARDPIANGTILFYSWRNKRNWFGFCTSNCKNIGILLCLKLSSNAVCHSNDEKNFLHK